MKLSAFHTWEFVIFLFIVFCDVASLNLWEIFDGETGVRVYYISEAVRTFLLYWFIHYLVSLGGIKDKRTHKATICATHAMCYYAGAYIIKEILGIQNVNWLDWVIFGATILYWIVKYYGYNNIRRSIKDVFH